MAPDVDTFISLGDAVIRAVDTCAKAFETDQRVLPPDHADTRLWGPMAGANYDERIALDGIDLTTEP